MLQPHTGSLLVDYYETFLRDQDVDAFRRSVAARYGQATLARLLHSGDLKARRASVLALGLFGGIESNADVARALKDPDPTIRNLADNALWAIWFRADTPENNKALERIQDQIGRGQFREAIDAADSLIANAPDFAEAYNQRAIANYRLGRFAESIADCKATVARNPYHTGALSGMAQCQYRIGQTSEALATFRRALEIQPYSESLRQCIAELEAEGQ
ncbi:tetratricopeptide repeat protein [Tundrisphaera sp. TA3]|uniref:tetratricopeptide repeat protein n=1 Tax=Tundrisphaera sp. TA3 TaxID=3435775 RepID=UPI003EC11FA5